MPNALKISNRFKYIEVDYKYWVSGIQFLFTHKLCLLKHVVFPFSYVYNFADMYSYPHESYLYLNIF